MIPQLKAAVIHFLYCITVCLHVLSKHEEGGASVVLFKYIHDLRGIGTWPVIKGIEESDAGYVKKIAGITQEDSSLLSYLYQNAVSPHLAARIEGNPVDPETVKADFDRVKKEYDYVTVEGSGGIVCPIRWDEKHEILLEDIVKMLHLNTLVIADAGLGTINAVVLTVEYVRNHGMDVKGIILNHYSGGAMQEDNEKMIERLTGVPVIARVRDSDRELEVDLEVLKRVYD